MEKKTRSILEELTAIRITKDPEHIIESRASHIIDSAINLIHFIRESVDQETAYTLEKKFYSAIKNLDANKFTKGVSKIRDLKEIKKSFSLKEGDLRDEDE